MRWSEQDTSNPRCIIIQFHRPAKLKLVRICAEGLFPVCSPDIRVFYFSAAQSSQIKFLQEGGRHMPGHSQRNSITADRWKRKFRGSYAVFQVFAEVAGCVMMIGESGTNLPEERPGPDF